MVRTARARNKFINSTIPLNVRKAWLLFLIKCFIFQENSTQNMCKILDEFCSFLDGRAEKAKDKDGFKKT